MGDFCLVGVFDVSCGLLLNWLLGCWGALLIWFGLAGKLVLVWCLGELGVGCVLPCVGLLRMLCCLRICVLIGLWFLRVGGFSL